MASSMERGVDVGSPEALHVLILEHSRGLKSVISDVCLNASPGYKLLQTPPPFASHDVLYI